MVPKHCAAEVERLVLPGLEFVVVLAVGFSVNAGRGRFDIEPVQARPVLYL